MLDQLSCCLFCNINGRLGMIPMKSTLKRLASERFILLVYILTAVIIAIDRFVSGPAKYNNFRIFSAAFSHLTAHQNLHLEYPTEYFDVFLYNPSFCILFAPFSILPPAFGLCFWLVVSSTAVFTAIRKLPVDHKDKVFCWWFIYFELFKSLHSQQTNPVLLAAGLLTFIFLEKRKLYLAALFPVLAFCIKGYGLVFAALCVFYSGKRLYMAYTVLWVLVFILLPLPFTGFRYFIQTYIDWFTILVQDHQVNYGYSIMGLLKAWFPRFSVADAVYVQALGMALLFATWLRLLRSKEYLDRMVRIRVLAYLSVWVIVFNHAAEHPTYIIAACGVALYCVANHDRQPVLTKILTGCALAGSIFSRLEIYPVSWSGLGFQPFMIKTIPYVIVWVILQIQLFRCDRSLKEMDVARGNQVN